MQDLLNYFPPITLSEMKSVKLLNRIDTKYVTTRRKLMMFLELARNEYFVQDCQGRRLMPYHTIYLDTPQLTMYHEHQRGKKHRYKVRMRTYENDMATFIEVKDKSNKGRTRKKRIEKDDMLWAPEHDGNTIADTLTPDEVRAHTFVQQLVPYDADMLLPTIENRFRRITLVNKAMTERLTIDLDLRFHNNINGNDQQLPDIVVIELKRDGLIPSPAIGLLRQLRIKQQGFSKMAIGMALTSPDLKQNLFKERIRLIQRLTGSENEES